MSSTTSLRIMKFSAVGAIGIGVQLTMLKTLTATGIDYLWATPLAVECAVLHNFLWHRRFTWRDRRQPGWRDFLLSMLRFHVGNGLISVAGNLLLMRALVEELNLAILPANVASIAVCFVANFVAGDRWVFRLP